MVRINRLLVWGLVMCGLFAAGTAFGQVVYGQPGSAKLRAIYTSWETNIDGEDVTIDQIYVPFLAFVPLQENLEARVFLGGATNTLDGLDDSKSLNGLTDSRIQVNKSFSDDKLVLSLGLNLPTGKTSLDFEEEWYVTNVLAQDFLTLPLRRLGGGLGLSGMLGGATMAGDTRLGASALFHYTGEYEAYENNGDYNPGDYFSLNAGFSRPIDNFHLLGDMSFTSYSDDTQDGAAIYNRGNQWHFRLGGVWQSDKMKTSIDARYFVRDRNAIFDEQGALLNQLKIYGNEFDALGTINWFFDNKKTAVGPIVHLRSIAANEFELGSASTFGLGAQLKRQLNEKYELGLSAEYFTGEADGGALDLTGYQMATSLAVVF